jgi:hypothetical protein
LPNHGSCCVGGPASGCAVRRSAKRPLIAWRVCPSL